MFKILKKLTWKEWLFAIVSVGLIAFQVYLDLKLPDYMSEITMYLQVDGHTVSEVLVSGAKMLACCLGSLAAAAIVGLMSALIASRLSKTLRSSLFNKTMSFSMEEMNKFSTPSLITRSTNDITQVQMLISMGLLVMIKAPIMAVWAIIKIANKGFEWSMATLVAVAIMMLMMGIIIIFAIPKSTKIQKMTDNINRVTRENLTGVRVVRAYNAEEYQEQKFDVANRELTKTHLFVSKTFAIMNPVMMALFSGLTLAIYLIGAYMLQKSGTIIDQFTIFSNMVVFSAYAMQVIMAFMMFAFIFILYPRASVAAKRINEVLSTETKLYDGKGNVVGDKMHYGNAHSEESNAQSHSTMTSESIHSKQHYDDTSKVRIASRSVQENSDVNTAQTIIDRKVGEIEFRNVSFMYPDAKENILHGINFKVGKGETLAIIGSTGSGKSTLINLIPRFYDVSEGAVLVDGIDVRDYKQEQLRDIVGYVSQRAVLFSGNIESNVAFGKKTEDIIQDQMDNAISLSQSKEFVEGLEDGVKAPVSQGGTNFSGGQKQRISIARALYKNPEILIFDDSFSALDYKTDKKLRKELNEHAQDITKIIVAQRIGTIKDADQILVIDDGSIVGLGRHKELLKMCKEYQEIASSQLSKEELENEQ